MGIKYISEIRAFYDSLEVNRLSAQAINLWHALMHIANKASWKDNFSVAIATLELKTGLKKNAIINARNLLEQKGYIRCKKGTGNNSATYTIIPLAFVSETQSETQTETQSETQTETQSETQTETQTETINRRDKNRLDVSKKESVERKSASRFSPPAHKQVEEYCLEAGIVIDVNHFIDYYTANGWRVGKTPMEDWRAAVRNWTKRDKTCFGGNGVVPAPEEKSKSSFDTDEFFEAALKHSYKAEMS